MVEFAFGGEQVIGVTHEGKEILDFPGELGVFPFCESDLFCFDNDERVRLSFFTCAFFKDAYDRFFPNQLRQTDSSNLTGRYSYLNFQAAASAASVIDLYYEAHLKAMERAVCPTSESVEAGKTLINECLNECAEASHVGVQASLERQRQLNTFRAGFPKPGMGQAC